MMKYNLLLLLVVLQLGAWANNEIRPVARVALFLPDQYLLLGEKVANEVSERTRSYGDSCAVDVYLYAQLSELSQSQINQYQLVFLDIINPAKVEFILPMLDVASQLDTEVFLVGNKQSELLTRYKTLHNDRKTAVFYEQSGKENLVRMVLDQLKRSLGHECSEQVSVPIPEYALCDVYSNRTYATFGAYKAGYARYSMNSPWVALSIWRSNFLSEQLLHVKEHIRTIEDHGFNVLCYYGQPTLAAADSFFYTTNKERVPEAVLAMSAWLGVNPETYRGVFEHLGVPVINLVDLNDSEATWRESKKGISLYKRTNSLSIPEQMGMIQPTVTGVKEISSKNRDFPIKSPVQQQITKVAKRLQTLHLLQNKPKEQKKIALLYYSHPPGKELVGASYLNVVPNSLTTILKRLKKEGYNVGTDTISKAKVFADVNDHGMNIGNWAPAEIERVVQTGKAVLLPVQLYKTWFAELDPVLRSEVETTWGKPDTASVMTWRNAEKELFFVFPSSTYGNIILAPQPIRGWSHDLDVMHHDVSVPPHHQYIAFYLYLQHSFAAQAVVHIGTHSTLEWLPGKETGLNQRDASMALLGNMLNVYPYIVDDVGEGLQAKRRADAVIISHMTPPFDQLNLNPKLKELENLVTDFQVAESKSVALATAKMIDIQHLAKQQGLLADLGIDTIRNDGQMHLLEHYIEEVREQFTPMGLHSFGELPSAENIDKNVAAIAANQTNLSGNALEAFKAKIRESIVASAASELNALVDALDGKYVQASSGNDPLRNPASLPTGKNFYAFDPAYLPSASVYKAGKKLAKELLNKYQKEHSGMFPDKLTFNLWSTECIRNEGIMESQILYLLGIEPVYDGYGKVTDVKVIPRHVLGRPRTDIVLVPSGLYRDIFSQLLIYLDKAIQLAAKQQEVDNYVRRNSKQHYTNLIAQGVAHKTAFELSNVRIFTTPSGSYGTGTNTMTEASGTWQNENEVANVYLNRMHYPYSNKHWGELPEAVTDSLLGKLFRANLSGTDIVLHSRTSNLYAAIDNDDFFQYLGGTALAVRSIDGTTPSVIVSNLTQQGNMRQETLDYFLGREMQARYLNPNWISSMLKEGYSGARFIRMVSSNLWGWQVTVPEAVDANKWQQFYETYVEDIHELNIKEQFQKANNEYAYQVLNSRLLEVIRKGYWSPTNEVKNRILTEFNATVQNIGLSCNMNVCNNSALADYIQTETQQVPGLPASTLNTYKAALDAIRKKSSNPELPANAQIAQNNPTPNTEHLPKRSVKGYRMQEVYNSAKETIADPSSKRYLIVVVLAFFTLWYFMRKRKK